MRIPRWAAWFTTVALPGAVAAAAPTATPATPGRPNVVVIMADDFGYECLTANGGESYATPRLDALAAGGVRFTQCYVQPLCTPTRVELMTGRSNVRNYVRFGMLPAGETTFAQLLKRAGYATAVCGKWQLGQDPALPRRSGFDESFLWQHTRRPARYANPGLEADGVEKDYHDGEYGPSLVQTFALDFISRHAAAARRGDAPFFLYYPMMLTHAPFQPTPESPDWDPRAKGEKVNDHPKHFADMTAFMDTLVGKLLDRLDETGLRDDTLVLFLGDNGTGRGVVSRFRGNAFPGGKGQTTHRGMHVPCIASWPAADGGGRVCDDLVAAVDFLPTICEAAGVPVPDDLDGISFLPQVRGCSGKPREWIYSWYCPRPGPHSPPTAFAFNRNAKLYASGTFYDLADDPDEIRPLDSGVLTGPQAAAAATLQAALDRFATIRPPLLEPVEDDAAAESGGDRRGLPSRRKRAGGPR